ncbi:terminase small subunit [Marvinbryantia formatexigens DSM 14469]|uniref:Terminase small subunit n=1 Tax=Marvinbryantia formatexigens DSM 14469 TaxID=478749 RepID=C6LG44_9FIRM|nr:terminase small subunit [Marvinbryantia formatexigens]EET60408.1 terminase small subunit [Marvinbryantia formatexigens DSM 14469]UWO25252.1 terminase small subunit [Marvinbryantia formatexigens DSM 14469]SDH04255.1 phage terminase small subunit [Marvinbryantia formatexigens]
MPRKPDERMSQAKEMFLGGMKLVEIAGRLNLPEGTIRRWKSTYKWENPNGDDNERSDKNNERSDAKSERSERKQNRKRKMIAEAVTQVLENPDLTDKQRLFCCLYIRCFNATKAYQKAYGCSYETALTNGSALLKNTRVREEIRELKKDRLNREMLDEHDIFQKYIDIAFANITDFVEFGQEQIHVISMYGPVQVADPETGKKVPLMKTVNSVRLREHTDVDGTLISEVKQGRDGASIKLADRMKALQWLTDHMDLATAEQRARIELLKAQTADAVSTGNEEVEDWIDAVNDDAAEE